MRTFIAVFDEPSMFRNNTPIEYTDDRQEAIEAPNFEAAHEIVKLKYPRCRLKAIFHEDQSDHEEFPKKTESIGVPVEE